MSTVTRTNWLAVPRCPVPLLLSAVNTSKVNSRSYCQKNSPPKLGINWILIRERTINPSWIYLVTVFSWLRKWLIREKQVLRWNTMWSFPAIPKVRLAGNQLKIYQNSFKNFILLEKIFQNVFRHHQKLSGKRIGNNLFFGLTERNKRQILRKSIWLEHWQAGFARIKKWV